jgi:hypothetical protein
MAKARGSTKKVIGGPYLEAAFICEQLLQDKDGTYSAIRMVNRITFHEVTICPERGELIQVPLVAVVSFKAGDVQGNRELFLYLTTPSLKRGLFPGVNHPIYLRFEGGDTGVLLAFRGFPIAYEQEGTYWIDVVLGRKRLSRIPLTLKLKKEAPPPTSD